MHAPLCEEDSGYARIRLLSFATAVLEKVK
jgi:hypothetical protein